MKRVSSRQRLVSWDQFDATANSSDSESDDFQSARSSSYSSLALTEEEEFPLVGRKRDRPSSSKKRTPIKTTTTTTCFTLKRGSSLAKLVEAPTVIPALSWEFGTFKDTLSFDSLNQDVQLHTLSYLTVSDARAFSAVDRSTRRLVLSPDARLLWRDWYARKWPMLQQTMRSSSLTFKDATNLPTAGSTNFADKVNLSGLLGMAAKHQPQCIDKATLVPLILTSLRRFRPDPKRVIFNTLENGAVQFTGKVGTGDRCIRSDQPLPRPQYNEALDDKASLLKKILCRNAGNDVKRLPPWRPFVAPFVTRQADGSVQRIDLTPRLVSYYEVSILERPKYQQESDDDDDELLAPFPPPPRHPSAKDCVAVGLAPRRFHIHSRMPGWDHTSYGYHGDDGGIFHGAGEMERSFGPSFGEGDTVGCGIDYVTGGIFFTLNGEFLGYGWTRVDTDFLQQDLYPTVGVDTNWPIQCNYGDRPFEYDLAEMVHRHSSVVRECIAAGRVVQDKSNHGSRHNSFRLNSFRSAVSL